MRVTVSGRGACKRLLKEVAAGGKDVVDGIVKAGVVDRSVPSCGLKVNVDDSPNACGVVVLGPSALGTTESDEAPLSTGLI